MKFLIVLGFLHLMSDVRAVCNNKVDKYVSGDNHNVEEAKRFLQEADAQYSKMSNRVSLKSWAYLNDLTEENQKNMLDVAQEEAQFTKRLWKNATSFAWKDFKETNQTLYRWFESVSILGSAALPEDKFKELNKILADMADIYGKAKVCRYKDPTKCDMPLEPDLVDLFNASRDPEELKYLWSQWRDVTGRKVKDKFPRYVKLSNEAACLNGFSNAGELWRESYESETFEDDIEELWQTIRPFYQQLHAFVRRKLIQHYPNIGIKPDGPIPAHLYGELWGQIWSNIFDIVKPYPSKTSILSVDVKEAMRQKKMTPLAMFKMSEEFFTSLGLREMTPEFWNRSVIEKPTDKEMVCHASAFDFSDGKDFRIKMCTRVNLEDLITIHHEMGHVVYCQAYAHQPAVFRGGANPGFHEAVGDTIALSVSTPQHLKKVGLLTHLEEDEEADINTLMFTALEKIAFIPYGYLLDSWRWKMFDGTYKMGELNSRWWELRLHYQGLCPPVKRTNDDLDGAALYHVVQDIPYIRYFVSFIVQFQFHKALCDAAGHVGPLHKCDIYHSKEAGRLLSNMLSLGSSVPWKEAMKAITGSEKMDAGPIVQYFEPLLKWLKEQNKNEIVGWTSNDPMMCP